MNRKLLSIMVAIFVAGSTLMSCAPKSPDSPFDASQLVKPGDNLAYGSYVIYKVDDGIYKINDPGVTTGKGGAWGVDMYLVCGTEKALMIDLGNNYIKGYEKDLIDPRENAQQEFLDVVKGLAGDLPIEAAVTHMHPDHDGMTGAFLGMDVPFRIGEGEDLTALFTQHGLDSTLYKTFKQGEKIFDLGGGRIVETFLVRGHSLGGTVYILKSDKMLFSSDALGSGIGQSMRAVDRLQMFAVDSKKLVEYITANFDPYERYEIKVFTGHTWQNVYGGFMSPNKPKVDLGYLDWRFVQDVATCANGLLEGKWLEPGSGLVHIGNMEYTDSWPGAVGQAIMVYGTGTVIIPLEVAYEAAGLQMAKQ